MQSRIPEEGQSNRYAIIDVETTGGDPKRGKITDIAIFILEGEKLVDEFYSLINPECSIPKYISKLTGITNEMVQDAPKFYEVARRIVEITEGAVFVAHNVGYDYGFVQNEFKRLGFRYRRLTLDTVKLSRKLIPGHASYSLGNLANDLNIPLIDRHRAKGDALATVELFRILQQQASSEDLTTDSDITAVFGKSIARLLFEQLPEDIGVYYYHDAAGNIIYIGKSKNIARRTLSHFSNFSSKKAMDMCAHVADITYETASSELVALLKEDFEIKRHQPQFNRVQLRKQSDFGIYATYTPQGYLALTHSSKSKNGVCIRNFPSSSRAKKILTSIVEKYQLCQKICGLYKSSGTCFHHQIGMCNGACVGKEDPESYNERTQQAITYLHDIALNFYVLEENEDTQEVAFVKVEKGMLAGYGVAAKEFLSGNLNELDTLLTPATDTGSSLKIIETYMAKNPKLKIINF